MNTTAIFFLLFTFGKLFMAEDCSESCACSPKPNGQLTIDCSGSNLKTFPKISPKVTFANFSSNFFEFIDNSTFAEKESLKIADLESNQIFSLGAEIFRGCSNLQEVNLQHNELKFINSLVFDGIFQAYGDGGKSAKATQPIRVKLGNNPWHCNCPLKQVWNKFKTLEGIEMDPIVCATPEKFEGQQLSNLNDLCEQRMSTHDFVIICLSVLTVLVSIVVTVADEVIVRRNSSADEDNSETELAKKNLREEQPTASLGVSLGKRCEVGV